MCVDGRVFGGRGVVPQRRFSSSFGTPYLFMTARFPAKIEMHFRGEGGSSVYIIFMPCLYGRKHFPCNVIMQVTKPIKCINVAMSDSSYVM